MSKLDELLQELCPDGVEYKKIADIASSKKIRNKNHITENAYSITQRGLIPTSEYFGEKTKITSQDISGYYIVEKDWFVYSPSRIDVGSINFLRDDGPVIVSPLDVVFSVDLKVIRPEYLLNVLKSKDGMLQIMSHRQGIEGTGRKTFPFSDFAKINIPVPPLAVQDEVISILNLFSGLVDELTARQKQYSYYRNKLLSFDTHIGVRSDVVWQPLGKIADISRGVRVVKKDLLEEGMYPVFQNSLTPMGYYNQFNRKENATFLISAGAAGEIGYSTVNFWAADDCFTFDCNKELNSRFLYHALMSKQTYIYSQVRKASIPRLSREIVEKLEIPVPPLDVQERLVHVLDNFDAICSDLVGGDLFEIKGEKNYGSYIKAVAIGGKELATKEMPKVTTHIKAFDSYDRILLGFPVRYGSCPRLIRSFAAEYDFTGKDVYVFCTSGSSGPEKSLEAVKEICKGAKVHSAIRINGQGDDVLKAWLEN